MAKVPPKTMGDVFAERVNAIVGKMSDTAPHEGKVAISHVHEAYRKAHPGDTENPGVFGHRLVSAAKQRKIRLARADLPETMDRAVHQQSETKWDNDTVHFVVKP